MAARRPAHPGDRFPSEPGRPRLDARDHGRRRGLHHPRTPPVPGTASVPAGTASDPAPGDVCGDGQVRCFNPVLYAIDTVVPLISLDQRSTWYPDARTRDGTLMEWWLNAAAVLGWLLTSIFVLALASLARSL